MLGQQVPPTPGHPLADSTYINSAFYEIQDPSHQHNLPTHYRARVPFETGQAFPTGFSVEHDAQCLGEGHNFHPIPEDPEESRGSDEPLFRKFFGLPESQGHEPSIDLDHVSAFREQFNFQNDSFDPAARQPLLREHFRNPSATAPLIPPGSNDASSLFAEPPTHDQLANSLSTTFERGRHHSNPPITAMGPSNGTPASLYWEVSHHSPGQGHALQQPSWIHHVNQPQSHYSSSPHYQNPSQSGSNPDMQHSSSSASFTAPVLPSQAPDSESSIPSASGPAGDHGPHHAQAGEEDASQQSSQSDQIHHPSTSPFPPRDMMEGVDIHSSSSSSNQASQKHTISGLASRRQRRPAALGTNTFRSASFNIPGPDSPQYPSQSAGTDANLRRIKSTAFGGRVHKPSQRSPFQRTFTDPCASPNPSVFLANTSAGMDAVAGSDRSSTAPITPTSELYPASHSQSGLSNPSDNPDPTLQRENSSQLEASFPQAGADVPMTSPWTMNPHTGNSMDTAYSYASPPHTPMDRTRSTSIQIQIPQENKNHATSMPNGSTGFQTPQISHHPANFHNNPAVHNHSYASPQSAPAWQQHFHPPNGSWPDAMPSSAHMQQHQPFSAHPLLPGATPGEAAANMMHQSRQQWQPEGLNGFHGPTLVHGGSGPVIHASPEYPSGHSRQPTHAHQVPMVFPAPFEAGQFPPTSAIAGSEPMAFHRPVSSSPHPKTQPELQVHHYSPPNRADSVYLPPKTRSTPQEKREFNFQNTFPEPYTSSPASSSH